MNQVPKPKCPPGCEELNTREKLAARMGCSRVEAGRRIAFGKIKAAHTERSSSFYRTEDLDRFRAGAVDDLGARLARLSTSEKAAIVGKMIELTNGLADVVRKLSVIKNAQVSKR